MADKYQTSFRSTLFNFTDLPPRDNLLQQNMCLKCVWTCIRNKIAGDMQTLSTAKQFAEYILHLSGHHNHYHYDAMFHLSCYKSTPMNILESYLPPKLSQSLVYQKRLKQNNVVYLCSL
jgi:hypothetical protein